MRRRRRRPRQQPRPTKKEQQLLDLRRRRGRRRRPSHRGEEVVSSDSTESVCNAGDDDDADDKEQELTPLGISHTKAWRKLKLQPRIEDENKLKLNVAEHRRPSEAGNTHFSIKDQLLAWQLVINCFRPFPPGFALRGLISGFELSGCL